MKRLLALLSSITILVIFLLPISAFAGSASASMSGTGTVRAGDTITVTFSLGGSNIEGIQGSLSYDSSKLTLTGTSQKIGSPWAVEFNGTTFVCYDNQQTAPITGGKAIFSATFKVNGSLAAGSSISVAAVNIVASDGSDIPVSNAAYSAAIAAPLSSNTNLASLSVSNATISPAFNKNTTSYKASVDFSVTKLSMTATAEDTASSVSISGNSLAVGTNSVKITVKAQSGATKTYTIAVTRAQDPNYKASTTCALSGINITGFVLSPVFNAGVKSYVVYLPYETTSIAVAGTPSDAKSTVKVEGGTDLAVGDNTVKVICTAEDGQTSETYTICAKREPLWGSKSSNITTTAKASTVSTDNEKQSKTPIWLIIILCVVSAALGFVISMIIYKKKMNNNDYYDDDDNNDSNSGSGTYNDINYNRTANSNSNQNSYKSTVNQPVPPVGLNNSTANSTANPPVRTTNTTTTVNPPVRTTNTTTAVNPPVRPNTSNTADTTNSVNNSNTTNASSFENNPFYKKYLDSYSNDADNSNSNDNNTQNQEKKGRFIKNPFEQSADD